MSEATITVELVIRAVPGLVRRDLERWIANDWIRPDDADGIFVFHEIDVARARLIHELSAELQVNEEALPVVLSLLDQLYDARRRMRALTEAVAAAPDETRWALLDCLGIVDREPPNQL